jgi:hypothetical protein
MLSAIINIYKKKTKGPTLMELFTATEKKLFWQIEKFDVWTTGDTTHIDTIFKFLPHTRQRGCIDIVTEHLDQAPFARESLGSCLVGVVGGARSFGCMFCK